jgi:hypothetical protein
MRWIKLCAVLAGLALTAAACGGAANAGDASDSEKNREDQLVEYTRCMREHGIDVEASEDDGRFKIAVGGPASGAAGEKGGPDEDMNAAMEACKDKLPRFGEDLTPEERAEMEDAMLEFSNCMREHGIDMPDPGQGGFVQKFEGKGDGPTPEDEDFQAAEKACEDKLPNKGTLKEGF